MNNQTNSQQNTYQQPQNTKYCKHCGAIIPADAVFCASCGCQVETVQRYAQPTIVINNSNMNSNINSNIVRVGNPRNKWVALLLCFFLGLLGGHKFYEGKAGMGVLYILTVGLFGIGVIVDFIVLLMRPNPYYV